MIPRISHMRGIKVPDTAAQFQWPEDRENHFTNLFTTLFNVNPCTITEKTTMI